MFYGHEKLFREIAEAEIAHLAEKRAFVMVIFFHEEIR